MQNLDVYEILNKIKNNTATDEERSLLESWYLQYNRDKELNFSETEFDEVSAELWNRLQPIDQVTKTKPVWPKVAVAASILLCLGFGTFYYVSSRRTGIEVAKSLPHKIISGSNKAILTLSNGQQIELNDASSGTVAKQSSIIISKTNDGKIIYSGDSQVRLYNTTTTPRGGKFELILADGTKVVLDASSSIKYPVAFTGRYRQVEVTGQVYFEVAHNPAKPFRVTVKGETIEVLGTHFNVNAYDDEPSTKTTLLQGKVKISYLAKNVILSPGQQAIVSPGVSQINTGLADTAQAVAWKNGMFRFNNTDLRSVMRQIGRWYNVEIVYAKNLKNDDVFEGSTPRSADVETILARLAVTGSVKFKIEGDKILISSK